MQRPDEEVLNAIVSLQGDPRWEKVYKWFVESEHQAMKELHVNTIFNGGRSAELFDLLVKIDTAKKELDIIRKKQISPDRRGPRLGENPTY